jgi:hypothetical protein
MVRESILCDGHGRKKRVFIGGYTKIPPREKKERKKDSTW